MSDLRAQYDLGHLHEAFLAFRMVRINATKETRQYHEIETTDYDTSVFETELDTVPVDWEIPNDDSLEALGEHASEFFSAIS